MCCAFDNDTAQIATGVFATVCLYIHIFATKKRKKKTSETKATQKKKPNEKRKTSWKLSQNV